MDESVIGRWVMRHDGAWHLAQSVINAKAVTRCGRAMAEQVDGRPLVVHDGTPGRTEWRCRRCDPEGVR